MAYAFLTTGSTTFAAGSWSDATGFANSGTLAIESGSQTIVSALDQSALGTGLNYFNVGPLFSGDIGSPSAGSLKVDIDAGTDPHFTYAASGGHCYLTAGGGNTLITRVECNSNGGTLHLTGGIFTNLDVVRGTCTVNESTVVTNAYLVGGTTTIEYNATALTILNIGGGTHTLKRTANTVILSGGTLYVDIDSGSLGATIVTVTGGVLVLKSGAIPVAVFIGGRIDLSQIRKPSVIAGTSAVVYASFKGALAQSPGNLVTWTTANISYRGSYTEVGEA